VKSFEGKNIYTQILFVTQILKKNEIYRTIISSVSLHGTEICSRTFSNENRMSNFESNNISSYEEVTAGWRNACNEHLHNL
jgi:hypothetical protein